MAEKHQHKESECKKKCLRNKYTTVEGQLIALSHIIYANPSFFLIELIDGQTLHHVAIKNQKHKGLQKHLNIGGSYRFTHLKQCRIRYSDGRVVNVNISTATSSFIVYGSIKVIIAKPKRDTIFYMGVVTAAVPFLGLYELDYRRIVYLNFLMGHCNISMPELGKKISVYNAHFWRNTELKRCALILCGRSCITIEKEQTKLDIYDGKTDLVEDYGTVWMSKLWETVLQKFSNNFIVQNINIRYSVPIFQQQILLQFIGFHYTTNANEKRHLTREFLSQPHECVFTESEKLSHENIITVLDAKNEMEKYFLTNLQLSTWHYHVTHSDANNTTALIGLLSTKNGFWMLSDSTGLFACIVMGTVEELQHIYNAVIFIKRYKYIMEVFKGKKSKILTYLQFNASDAIILCVDDTKDMCKRKGSKNELEHCVKMQTECGDYREEGIYGKEKVGEDETTNCSSCLMRVLHKSTPAMTPVNDIPVCCILAVFPEVKYEQKQFFLVLTGKLVGMQPTLNVGSVYTLFTPGHQICKVLENCCKLKSLSQVLPDVIGAVLPEDSRIFPVDGQGLTASLSNNIYRVDDKSFHEEAGQKEMVDVEGIITDRLHTKIRFVSEKHQSEKEYFSVPDYQNIVLNIIGTSGKNDEVTLYLNNWGTRAYPVGLVPGTRIQACFVAKYTAQSSARTYFQATELTRIDVLQMTQEKNCATKNNTVNWPKPCILTKEANRAAPGAILCGLISNVKVWKITAEVICQYCAEACQDGKCNTCIFSASVPQLTLSVNCYLEDVFGEVVLLVQRNQVYQLFERSRSYWNVLSRVIAKEHNKISVSDSDVPKTTSKRILHCMLTTLNNKLCHWLVLARKLRPQSSDQRNVLFCMELEKPKPSFMQNLLKDTSCFPNGCIEQHRISSV